MAINLVTDPAIAGRITAPDADYPGGSSKDETGEGAADGTPYVRGRANDIFGLEQALLGDAGLVPSGDADTAIKSQYLQGASLILKSGAFKNPMVNGDSLINQRGLSFTPAPDDYTSDNTQYTAILDGGALNNEVVTIETFPLGQTDVPGNPKNFLRYEGDIVGGGIDHALVLFKHIEDVSTFSNELVTLTFSIKGSTTGIVRHAFTQEFGTGGGESTAVNAYAAEDISVDTSWQQVSFTFTMPNIAGKFIGANGDDRLIFNLIKQQGTDSAIAYGTTGAIAFTGSIDIADVQLERGRYSSRFERLSTTDALIRAQRYLNRYLLTSGLSYVGKGSATTDVNVVDIPFKTRMRTTPTASFLTGGSKTSSIYRVSDGTFLTSNPLILVPLNENVFSLDTQSASVIQHVGYFLTMDGNYDALFSAEY